MINTISTIGNRISPHGMSIRPDSPSSIPVQMYEGQPFKRQLPIFITGRIGCNMGVAASSLPFRLLLSWSFTREPSRGLRQTDPL
jgi:hypothetical protein